MSLGRTILMDVLERVVERGLAMGDLYPVCCCALSWVSPGRMRNIQPLLGSISNRHALHRIFQIGVEQRFAEDEDEDTWWREAP